MAVLQRIAVADDDQIIRQFYCKVLMRKGLNVVVIAGNGRELVDGCRQEQPDLIICDIRMPELDGLSALHLIAGYRPTPAIIISAHSEQEFFDHAGNEYVLAFLIKPVGMRDLDQAVTRVQQRLQQQEWWHA